MFMDSGPNEQNSAKCSNTEERQRVKLLEAEKKIFGNNLHSTSTTSSSSVINFHDKDIEEKRKGSSTTIASITFPKRLQFS
jgi:hypothetical protein